MTVAHAARMPFAGLREVAFPLIEGPVPQISRPQAHDLLSASLDRLCQSPTGKAILDDYVAAGLKVEVFEGRREEIFREVLPGTLAGFDDAKRATLIPASQLLDADRGALLLGHEMLHGVDFVSGTTARIEAGRHPVDVEVRAYHAQSRIARELGVEDFGSGSNPDGSQKRTRQLRAELLAFDRYGSRYRQ